MTEKYHIPIMLEECMSGLDLKKDGIYLDGTLGGGGHSYEILKRTAPNGKLIGIDRDVESIRYAKKRLEVFGNRAVIVKSNFFNATEVLDELNIKELDGALFDLGISSKQIDDADRGFSYMADAMLDMRMDQNQTLTAYDIINNYSESDLNRIIFEYGEERYSRIIVKNIISARKISPIKTTLELSEIIKRSVPQRELKHGHPAKKTFQAIRIEVNGELKGLSEAIFSIIKRLKKGGRLAVITFHSLEDRIIKKLFKQESTDCLCDKSIPICICKHKRMIKSITDKPLIPTEEELKTNTRAASAKLRIAEKL